MDRKRIDMDETPIASPSPRASPRSRDARLESARHPKGATAPGFRIVGHHHMAADLPRDWIVLPPSARAGACAHPLLKGLLPSHVGFFPRASRHCVHRPTGVEQAIFKYCVRGAGWCEIDGRRHDVRAGDLMVVPPCAPHKYGATPESPWTVHWFHATGEHLEALMSELEVGRAAPIVHLGRDPRLLDLFRDLQPVLDEDYAFPQLLYASQLLGHLVGVMIRLRRERRTETPHASRRVLATVERMKHRLDDALDVVQLATHADLSVSHYAALFRRLTGSSPKVYFDRLRLERAAQLLLTSEQTIGAIARQVGYDDPLHFSRRFKAVRGIAPSAYRQRRGRDGC